MLGWSFSRCIVRGNCRKSAKIAIRPSEFCSTRFDFLKSVDEESSRDLSQDQDTYTVASAPVWWQAAVSGNPSFQPSPQWLETMQTSVEEDQAVLTMDDASVLQLLEAKYPDLDGKSEKLALADTKDEPKASIPPPPESASEEADSEGGFVTSEDFIGLVKKTVLEVQSPRNDFDGLHTERSLKGQHGLPSIVSNTGFLQSVDQTSGSPEQGGPLRASECSSKGALRHGSPQRQHESKQRVPYATYLTTGYERDDGEPVVVEPHYRKRPIWERMAAGGTRGFAELADQITHVKTDDFIFTPFVGLTKQQASRSHRQAFLSARIKDEDYDVEESAAWRWLRTGIDTGSGAKGAWALRLWGLLEEAGALLTEKQKKLIVSDLFSAGKRSPAATLYFVAPKKLEGMLAGWMGRDTDAGEGMSMGAGKQLREQIPGTAPAVAAIEDRERSMPLPAQILGRHFLQTFVLEGFFVRPGSGVVDRLSLGLRTKLEDLVSIRSETGIRGAEASAKPCSVAEMMQKRGYDLEPDDLEAVKKVVQHEISGGGGEQDHNDEQDSPGESANGGPRQRLMFLPVGRDPSASQKVSSQNPLQADGSLREEQMQVCEEGDSDSSSSVSSVASPSHAAATGASRSHSCPPGAGAGAARPMCCFNVQDSSVEDPWLSCTLEQQRIGERMLEKEMERIFDRIQYLDATRILRKEGTSTEDVDGDQCGGRRLRRPDRENKVSVMAAYSWETLGSMNHKFIRGPRIFAAGSDAYSGLLMNRLRSDDFTNVFGKFFEKDLRPEDGVRSDAPLDPKALQNTEDRVFRTLAPRFFGVDDPIFLRAREFRKGVAQERYEDSLKNRKGLISAAREEKLAEEKEKQRGRAAAAQVLVVAGSGIKKQEDNDRAKLEEQHKTTDIYSGLYVLQQAAVFAALRTVWRWAPGGEPFPPEYQLVPGTDRREAEDALMWRSSRDSQWRADFLEKRPEHGSGRAKGVKGGVGKSVRCDVGEGAATGFATTKPENDKRDAGADKEARNEVRKKREKLTSQYYLFCEEALDNLFEEKGSGAEGVDGGVGKSVRGGQGPAAGTESQASGLDAEEWHSSLLKGFTFEKPSVTLEGSSRSHTIFQVFHIRWLVHLHKLSVGAPVADVDALPLVTVSGADSEDTARWAFRLLQLSRLESCESDSNNSSKKNRNLKSEGQEVVTSCIGRVTVVPGGHKTQAGSVLASIREQFGVRGELLTRLHPDKAEALRTHIVAEKLLESGPPDGLDDSEKEAMRALLELDSVSGRASKLEVAMSAAHRDMRKAVEILKLVPNNPSFSRQTV